VWNWYYVPDVLGAGLRGGRWTVDSGDVETFTFHKVRWTTDSTVDGTATWDTSTGQVRANLVVRGFGHVVHLHLAYRDLAARSHAVVTGSDVVGGHAYPLRTSVYAS